MSFLSSSISEHINEGDIVIHLARTIRPSTRLKNYTTDIQDNIIGTLNLYEIAVTNKAKRFIYVNSGGTIYGNAIDHKPIRENQSKDPVDLYGLSSLTTERYLRILSREKHTALTVLRVANPYGPGQEFRRGQGIINLSLIHI